MGRSCVTYMGLIRWLTDNLCERFRCDSDFEALETQYVVRFRTSETVDHDALVAADFALFVEANTMAPAADTRQVVGGVVWAKAEAVSHDAKRIFGAALSKTWLCGKVLSVEKRGPMSNLSALQPMLQLPTLLERRQK